MAGAVLQQKQGPLWLSLIHRRLNKTNDCTSEQLKSIPQPALEEPRHWLIRFKGPRLTSQPPWERAHLAPSKTETKKKGNKISAFLFNTGALVKQLLKQWNNYLRLIYIQLYCFITFRRNLIKLLLLNKSTVSAMQSPQICHWGFPREHSSHYHIPPPCIWRIRRWRIFSCINVPWDALALSASCHQGGEDHSLWYLPCYL